jgi:hypothetical protein
MYGSDFSKMTFEDSSTLGGRRSPNGSQNTAIGHFLVNFGSQGLFNFTLKTRDLQRKIELKMS